MKPTASIATASHASSFMVELGPWPTMIAHLLLAIVGDSESQLGEDITRARRLATLLREDAGVMTALARAMIERPGDKTVPHVEIVLAAWSSMRAELLMRAVEHAGSVGAASFVLDVPVSRLRRDLRQARRAAR